jgi:hypothetical protein
LKFFILFKLLFFSAILGNLKNYKYLKEKNAGKIGETGECPLISIRIFKKLENYRKVQDLIYGHSLTYFSPLYSMNKKLSLKKLQRFLIKLSGSFENHVKLQFLIKIEQKNKQNHEQTFIDEKSTKKIYNLL